MEGKGVFRGIAERLFWGFLQGIGLAVGIAVVIYLIGGRLTESMYEPSISSTNAAMEEPGGFKRFGPESGLKIARHYERRKKNGVEIIAEIQNTGNVTWSGVSVEVEFLDKSGKFVDQCSGYLQGKIGPSQTRNMKIGCGGCENNPLQAYDRYTIEIRDASSF